MDGLLIDSEPFWQRAEIEIFRSVGVNLNREMCMETMGLRIDEVIHYWYRKSPWKNMSYEELQGKIITRVIEYIRTEGKVMPGVFETIELLKGNQYKLALASSSHFIIIKAVIEKLKLGTYFEVVHSAEMEEFGKPHPAIYINTARLLGLSPLSCMAFEDSFNGLIAAKAARMKTIAIPDPSHFQQSRFDIADLKLSSLSLFKREHLTLLER